MKRLLIINTNTEYLLLKVMVRLYDYLEKMYIKYENLKPMGKVERLRQLEPSPQASEF